MNDEVFNKIADHAFRKVLKQYEHESEFDKTKIKTDKEFFDFVGKQIAAVKAHNERYTDELVKGIINFYENKNN